MPLVPPTTPPVATRPVGQISAADRPFVAHRKAMTTIHDIACPYCDRVDPVVKEGLDAYRCTECDRTFSATDVL